MMIFVFLACGKPELHIFHEGVESENIEKEGRHLILHPSFSLQLQNKGTATLEITDIDMGEEFSIDVEFPLLLEPEEEQDLLIDFDPKLEGEYSQEIQFLGNIVVY